MHKPHSSHPAPSPTGEPRRVFLTRAALLSLSGGASLLARSVGAEVLAGTPAPGASPAPGLHSPLLDQAQALTATRLARMEESLQAVLAGEDAFSEDALRGWLISLSMWGPLAGLTQETLAWLGDSPDLLADLPLLPRLVRWMAAPYIFPVQTSGPPQERDRSVAEVFRLIAELRQRGLGASLDNVGDASLSPADARAYRDYYLLLMDRFIHGRSGKDLYLSLKLSALTHDLDAALGQGKTAQAKRREIKDALGDMLAKAAQAPQGQRVFIRIDMEEYAYKDLTLELFREVVEADPNRAKDDAGGLRLGVVIQAYLRDAARDVKALADWAKGLGVRVPIRLVKGAYLDHERELARAENRKSPVWNFKPSTDANYEALSAYLLLRPDALTPAFATHNLRSMAHATALHETLAAGEAKPEMQMLRGMGDPIKEVVVAMGYGLREYVPAGSLARGLKYASRRFQELSSQDNALTRTMRGDFSVFNRGAPRFMGEEDARDGQAALELLGKALAARGTLALVRGAPR